MLDLAARIYYKVHFDIVRHNSSVNLLKDVIINNLAEWLNRKYPQKVSHWNWGQFADFGKFITDDYSLVANTTSFFDSPSLYWACKIDEYELPEIGDNQDQITVIERAPRIWTTEVGYEQKEADRATISYVVYYSDKAGFVGLLDEAPSINVPGFVRSLIYCNGKPFDCVMGSTRLSPIPIPVAVGTGHEFAKMLMNPERKVPVILSIPSVEPSKNEFPTKELARNVMGNALVYVAQNPAFAEELTYFLNHQFWCHTGQIRLYWPQSTSNSQRRNRYLREDQIEAIGTDAVIGIFRRVLSQDVRFYESQEMFRIEDCNELYRKSRANKLRLQYQEAQESIAHSQSENEQMRIIHDELLKLADEDIEKKAQEIERLTGELDEAKKQIWQLKGYNETLASEQERARKIIGSLDNLRDCKTMPKSALEVAKYFQQVFGDKIDFTDRGLRSLESCITKSEILWECFHAIATSLTDLYASNNPNIEQAFREATGWDMARGEGSTTRSNPNLMALRRDSYQGREIFIEPHVRKGNRDKASDVRVYFCYDIETKRIIIGHVGSHLDNHSTLNVQ